jgi:TPR repeat protein
VELLNKAAVADHPAAVYAIAVIHFNGSGGAREDKDLVSGVTLCARAALLGHLDAVRELGHCLQVRKSQLFLSDLRFKGSEASKNDR